MAPPYHKNPCPTGHEIYNFTLPFLGHHYYILGLSDLCLGLEKIFKRNNADSLYAFYGHVQTQNPCPVVIKFTILVDPSLVIITTCLLCLLYAWE